MPTTKVLELYGLIGLMTIGISMIPLIVSAFFINYGRFLLFLYRFVSPVVAILVLVHAFPNLLGQATPGMMGQNIFGHMITTFLGIFLYLVFWGITSFLTVGPPRFFLFLAELQLKTTLRRRATRGGTEWIRKDEARTRDRREWAARTFHMPFLAPHMQPKRNPVLNGKIVNPNNARRRRELENVNNLSEHNQQPTPSRLHEESSQAQRQREEENNLANGKVNWRPIGKQYKPNARALERIFGMQEVLDEIERSIKIPLENPKLVREYDMSMNAGILLYGPPGTGKTELARAVAEHLGLYFISVRSSDLVGTLVGATEQNITSLFKEAKQHTPSIIFIDEIDAIGSARGSSHTHHDGPLTQLLAEMDGFEKRDGVFVIAATNRMESLDAALIRGGRFGTHIEVPAPDEVTLWNMFGTWAEPLHLAQDVRYVEVGLALRGHTGATVKALVEKLKQIEIQKRVTGKQAITTRDDVFTELEKLVGNKTS